MKFDISKRKIALNKSSEKEERRHRRYKKACEKEFKLAKRQIMKSYNKGLESHDITKYQHLFGYVYSDDSCMITYMPFLEWLIEQSGNGIFLFRTVSQLNSNKFNQFSHLWFNTPTE